MNILWDFRLFSYGYRTRGVGVYTSAMACAYLKKKDAANIFVLGNKVCLPESINVDQFNWIDYKQGGWKKDLLTIPSLIRHYKIDIYHYWIALGPMHQIGLGLFHGCSTVATIYDLGTENWDVPFLKSVKKSWYWKTQKKLIPYINKIICISETTSSEFLKKFPIVRDKIEVIYKPVNSVLPEKCEKTRDKYFITMGGSRHKNLARVVKAFDLFRKSMPDYKLIILGWINRQEEGLDCIPPGVIFEDSMNKYNDHLKKSSGLIFCSVYEGLGLPPIEGMSYGCPLLVSDIPSVHEICNDAAVFVDPMNLGNMAEGMLELAINNEFWSSRSFSGASEYELKTRNSADRLIDIYQNLL